MEDRPEDEAEGDSKRVRNYTEKGLQYQRSVLMDRRSQLHKRLMRKSSIIDDLLYSKQNLAVVKENLGQFDDVFKLLTEVHQQHCKLLSEEEQHVDNQWFEDADEMVFSFKQYVYNWVGTRTIKGLHVNLQQSQEALTDRQEQGQHHHQSHTQRKEPLRRS